VAKVRGDAIAASIPSGSTSAAREPPERGGVAEESTKHRDANVECRFLLTASIAEMPRE